MSQQATAVEERLDPVTFEVIRHKLTAISEEQAITLKAASGSPVVTDATDFNNGIYLPDGSIVTMGPQVLFHSGSMRSVIKNIVATSFETPGIHEGDMFILNDPYRGAVHQPDVSVVAPVFHAGRQVAWVGVCAHELDVGGMTFGSWCTKATDVHQEAMLLPGLKLVERGELREDLWRTILANSRLPMLIGLDLKAMIAANNVAIARLQALMDRYGTDVVEEAMRRDLDASERRLRARLAELPDGVYRAVDFIEHDGLENRLYEFRLALRKTDDELTFDMTGSSEQSPGFINCTYSGLVGALYAALLPILAPDIRWNEGLMRPVRIEAPEGTVCNARWPAAVSGATVSAIWVCANLSAAAISRLAACSPQTSAEAAAVTKGSMMVVTLGGRDRDGGPFGTLLMDGMAGGGGAYADHDGLTGSGDYCVPRPAISNVENQEASAPLLYLYRRIVPDTGGAGSRRGGATGAVAFTPHDTSELELNLISHGTFVPNSVGLFGGLEGSTNEALLWRQPDGGGAEAAVRLRADEVAERGEALGPKPGVFALRPGDVFAYRWQGGGGFGDPLNREAELVAADVREGLVTPEAAAEIFGVELVDTGVDADATQRRRRAMRAERVGSVAPVLDGAGSADDAQGAAVGPVMRHREGRIWCRCGHDLGEASANFKDRAATRAVAPRSHGLIALHEALELREHCCPACGTLLESEVARRGGPSLHSIELAQ